MTRLQERSGATTVPTTLMLTFALAATAGLSLTVAQPYAQSRVPVPQLVVDASWPKPLPNNWTLGQVSGIAVDSRDHIWILQRPGSLANDEKLATTTPPTAECCVPAPPVIEFDQQGNVVSSWGGPGQGYEWPAQEHGLSIDHKGQVWITGSGQKDFHILKFTREGKFLLQIGKQGQAPKGNNDTTTLGRPAEARVEPTANEVYVTDGEVGAGANRRVIVFDADTGAYKRHWGAYGQPPDDAPPPAYDPSTVAKVFGGGGIHCVRFSKDGLVYICDRGNSRIQVFTHDGTFVKEIVVAKDTRGLGSTWDVELSRDERFVFVADGVNHKIWILTREPLEVVGSFGRMGRNAGQFRGPNAIAFDSKGNLFTAEVADGKRVQKFAPARARR